MKNKIKSFEIKGLFGKIDVKIPLNKPFKIFVGDNGLGKTHVLDILYLILRNKPEELKKYPFESVTIAFDNNNKAIIERISNFKLENIVKNIKDGYYFLVDEKIIKKIAEDIIENISYSVLKKKYEVQLPDVIEFKDLHESISKKIIEEQSDKVHIKKNELFANFYRNLVNTNQLIYFSTHRELEMSKIQRRLDSHVDFINSLSKKGFSKISSEILSQLVKGLPPVNKEFLDKISLKDVEIILARVGEQISDEDKEKIKQIVSEKRIETKDASLLYFLEKLISIYEEQKEIDEQIRNFCNVCNKYLEDKELVYDEGLIDIYVRKKSYNQRLELSNLSSGEKQIFLILSQVYLPYRNEKSIILIDEPELSLSVFWQEMLLSDIWNSGNCSLLIAATHSPFIYEDTDIEHYAVNLHEYITQRN